MLIINIAFNKCGLREIKSKLELTVSGLRFAKNNTIYEYEWSQIEALERHRREAEYDTFITHNLLLEDRTKIDFDCRSESIREAFEYIILQAPDMPVRYYTYVNFSYSKELSVVAKYVNHGWEITGSWNPLNLFSPLIIFSPLFDIQYQYFLSIKEKIEIFVDDQKSVVITEQNKRRTPFLCSCGYKKIPIVGNNECKHVQAIRDYEECIQKYGDGDPYNIEHNLQLQNIVQP